MTAMSLKERLYHIIFESDTPLGRLFDRILIAAILLSLVVVVVDSVEWISMNYHAQLSILEWLFTIFFSIEYACRVYCARQRWQYITSFYGVIDLLAVLPTYLAMLFPEMHALIDVRVLRLIRIFRIFKLTAYMHEYTHLTEALHASRRKIMVFLSVVLMVVMVMGTLMYVVEGPRNGFTSIPVGIYWAITTMTTVGFGDITPHTDLGRLIASLMMLMGWGTLAVPTGIVTAEMSGARRLRDSLERVGIDTNNQQCSTCLAQGLGANDRYCRRCGAKL